MDDVADADREDDRVESAERGIRKTLAREEKAAQPVLQVEQRSQQRGLLDLKGNPFG